MSAKQTKPVWAETAPKILLIDTENFPNECWTWDSWETNVIDYRHHRMICSVAWQWYPSHKKFVKALPDFPGYNPKDRNNKALMLFIKKELMDKADIILAQNGDRFDIKMMNTDLLKNNLPPPPPHKSIDTLRILKSKFRLNSNRLGDVCELLGIGSKVKHPGFPMWVGCMAGNEKSWAQMRHYNMGDIEPTLRGLYERLKPWANNHPNMCASDKFSGCSVCRSTRLERRGWNTNRWGKSPRFQCLDCGKWMSGVCKDGEWRFR